MFRKALVLLIVAGLLAGFASAGSAIFTSSTTVAANTFTTGTVIITTDHTSSALFNVTNMAPGDVVYAPLTVSNTGSLALRYAMTSTTNSGTQLAGQLNLGIRKVADAASCTAAGFNASTDVALADRVLDNGTTTAGFGSTVQGPDSGDRTLAPSGNEVLCFKASLPIGTGNTFQGVTTTTTFTFAAEQTANNP